MHIVISVQSFAKVWCDQGSCAYCLAVLGSIFDKQLQVLWTITITVKENVYISYMTWVAQPI